MDGYEMIGVVGIVGTAYILALFNEEKRIHKLAIIGMLRINLGLFVHVV